MTLPAIPGNEVMVYIDFDSCYYNISRRLYRILPWTIIINKFNHVISTPHWLEGHFGVKKIDYLAPSVRIKLKAGRLVEVFCIDRAPSGRSMMVGYVEEERKKVELIAPGARVVHKDSITAKVERSRIGELKSVVGLPCTVGVGISEDEAIQSYREGKQRRKRRLRNTALLVFWFVPMVVCSLLGIHGRGELRCKS